MARNLTPIAIRLSGIGADALAWADQLDDVQEARLFLLNIGERIQLLDAQVAALEVLRQRQGPSVVPVQGGAA